MKVNLVIAFAALFGLVSCSGQQPLVSGIGGDIQVVSATYGQNCGAPKGNVTGHLADACNNTNKCSYTVDYKIIGDPRPRCGKTYEAEYKCRSQGTTKTVSAPPEAGMGAVVILDCTRSVWDILTGGQG